MYHFKSYPDFVNSLGLDYNEIAEKRRWTDEDVVEEFKKYEANGHELNATSLTKINIALYAQICDRFGSYEGFLTNLGYDYSEITKRRIWSEQDVINALKEREANGESFVSAIIADEHFALYRACTTVFGSYRNAIEYAGLSYDSCVDDVFECSYFGREFENKLKEMFQALGYGYDYHYQGLKGIIPDFYDAPNNIIIDAKLSSWTVFNSSTIEKYIPHCDKLVIVYLRGARIKRRIDGMEMRHISYYYDELREKGLDHFIDEFAELRRKLDEKQSQKEAS